MVSERANPFRGVAQNGAPEGRAIDEGEARRALSLLVDPSGEAELRSVRKTESVVRKGGDIDGLVAAAAGMANAAATYLCLNPVSLGAPCERTASDEHVTRRRWLFLDIDSVRPDAKENCATDAEKETARSEKDRLREHLTALGWPEPVEVDSGNGFYLLYRIDLPNDEESRLLVRTLLHALAGRFDAAKIDRAVHNASRIARLPGTWNRKGRNSPDRPHRMCRLLSVPESPEIVTAAQIRQAGGDAPARHEGNGKSPFRGKTSGGRLEAYARRALEGELLAVALAVRGSAGGHGANNTLNEAAFSIGTILSWGVLDEAEAVGSLTLAAQRAGLEEVEIGPTIQSGLNAGKSKPRALPDWAQADGKGTPAGGAAGPQPGRKRWQVLYDGQIIAEGEPDEVREQCADADEDDGEGGRIETFELSTIGNIIATEYPEPRWVIGGLMSEGLNILAGAPKQGKSLMALNIALTVAGGGMALGDTRVEAADVLYLSLEDQQRRIKSRALKMLRTIQPTLSSSIAGRLVVTTNWPRQDAGGLRMIDLWSRRAKNPGLLIIDVWNRFCPVYKTTGSAYGQDADFMGEVKKYVEKRGFSCLIIHHTRKPGLKDPEDFVNEVSGTLGLSGAADGIMVLMRSRQEQQAALHVTGRDVPEQELVLEFDKDNLTWKSLGTKVDHVEGRVQQKVIRHLRSNRPTAFFIKDIALAVGEKDDSVKHACSNLLKNKIIRKSGNAFAYPGDALHDTSEAPDDGEAGID